MKPNKLFAFLTLTALLCSSNIVAQERTKMAIAYPGVISVSGSMVFAIAHEQGISAKYGEEARLLGSLADSIRLVGKKVEFGVFETTGLPRGTDLEILGAFSTGRISSHLVTRAEITRSKDLTGGSYVVV